MALFGLTAVLCAPVVAGGSQPGSLGLVVGIVGAVLALAALGLALLVMRGNKQLQARLEELDQKLDATLDEVQSSSQREPHSYPGENMADQPEDGARGRSPGQQEQGQPEAGETRQGYEAQQQVRPDAGVPHAAQPDAEHEGAQPGAHGEATLAYPGVTAAGSADAAQGQGDPAWLPVQPLNPESSPVQTGDAIAVDSIVVPIAGGDPSGSFESADLTPAPTPPIAVKPHGDLGLCLARFQSQVAGNTFSPPYADPQTSQGFYAEFNSHLEARLERFMEHAEESEEVFVSKWVRPDLVSTLDTLARFQSLAAAEVRAGNAAMVEVSRSMAELLYGQLDALCRQEGWFGVQRTIPFETPFDPGVHRAVAQAPAPGAAGLIVEVKAIGRVALGDPTMAAHAQVVVGM